MSVDNTESTKANATRCARCGVPEWDIAITTDGRQLATHPTPKCSEFDATPRCSRCGHKATYHGESRQGHAISQHSIHWCDCPAFVPPKGSRRETV